MDGLWRLSALLPLATTAVAILSQVVVLRLTNDLVILCSEDWIHFTVACRTYVMNVNLELEKVECCVETGVMSICQNPGMNF